MVEIRSQAPPVNPTRQSQVPFSRSHIPMLEHSEKPWAKLFRVGVSTHACPNGHVLKLQSPDFHPSEQEHCHVGVPAQTP